MGPTAAATVLSLDDPGALDPEAVGVKAARLSAARRQGYPVLPGWVVPSGHGANAMAAGQATLDDGRPASARLAARMAPISEGLRETLTGAARLGPRLVVRSSTRLDDDARWAGAFASFGELAPSELETALRGCWASVFAPDALSRLGSVGLRAADVGIAALIQPHAEPDRSGTADVTADGVVVSTIDGPPAPLLSGWRPGRRVTISPQRGAAVAASSGSDAASSRALALLAWRAAADFGCTRLEWAHVDGKLLIFQMSGGVTDRPASSEEVPDVAGLVAYRRLAAAILQRRGPLAERFLAPWAATLPFDVAPDPVAGRTEDLLKLATACATTLTEGVVAATGLEPQILVDGLARGDRHLGAQLAGVPPDPTTAGRLLGAADSLARSLVAAGLLRSPAELWWQTSDWLRGAIAGRATPASQRAAFDRFTPVLVGVARDTGRRWAGSPASPGLGVGRAVYLEGPDQRADLAPGDVVVVDAALPAMAPLLWTATGLIATVGSPAAHLFEVARSLRRPAVVDVDRGWEMPGARSLVALDGSSGAFWVSDLDRDLQVG